MRKGFTTLELLCVCVILAVLSALLTPVVIAAISSSKTTVAVSNLHQLHLSLMMYRSEYDGDARYGSASEMGLPSRNRLREEGPVLFNSQDMLFQPPCGVHPDLRDKDWKLIYGPLDEASLPEGGDPYKQAHDYYMKYQDQSILILDENCADHALPLYDPFTPKLLLAVRLSGQLERRTTHAYPDSFEDWNR